MSDNLLDVSMPPEPEPEPIREEIQEEEEEEVVEYAEQQEEEEEEDREVVEKQFIPDEEVFNPPKVQKVKRKCSEKQLAHLSKIREKALIKKQENKKFMEEQKAKQRKNAKSYDKPAQQSRRVVRKKVYVPPPQEEEEEIEYIYEEEYQQPQPPTRQEAEEFSGYQLTPAQIKRLQRDAIMDYEVIRKERKHNEKMQQQQAYIEQEKRKIMKQMGAPDNDPWSQCFQ